MAKYECRDCWRWKMCQLDTMSSDDRHKPSGCVLDPNRMKEQTWFQVQEFTDPDYQHRGVSVRDGFFAVC